MAESCRLRSSDAREARALASAMAASEAIWRTRRTSPSEKVRSRSFSVSSSMPSTRSPCTIGAQIAARSPQNSMVSNPAVAASISSSGYEHSTSRCSITRLNPGASARLWASPTQSMSFSLGTRDQSAWARRRPREATYS